MHWPFVPHRRYVRRDDILKRFGGGWQGGISTAPGSNAIFLFTGMGGKSSGYQDGFLPDGRFRYTGEGQVGDQQFVRGNKALRDHQTSGWDVLLFEKVGSTPSVDFVGQFICDGYAIERQNDREGAERDAIVFFLTPFAEAALAEQEDEAEATSIDMSVLRSRAYASAGPATLAHAAAPRTIFKRSLDVKNYVLARAAGLCESCGKAAPFFTHTGKPYLEPHHIDRLSDGGPDSPDRVGAICPNCHREVHHGANGKAINATLLAKVRNLEGIG